MYRTGNGRSNGQAEPVARGFAGGIFSEHAFSEGTLDVGGVAEDFVNDAYDHSEEVRPEHLLHRDDQEALAIGRSVLSVARAFGGLVRAVASAGSVAAGDIERGGLRGALVQGMRRAADRMDQAGADKGYVERERFGSQPWPEDAYTARAAYDPRDPYRRFERDYADPHGSAGFEVDALAEAEEPRAQTTTAENANLGGRVNGGRHWPWSATTINLADEEIDRDEERDGPLVTPAPSDEESADELDETSDIGALEHP